MGLDLTWKQEDKINHGNCGEDLETIVHFRLPESSGFSNGGITSSSERDSHYAIFHPDVINLGDLKVPDGESSYAVEYTQMDMPLTRSETEDRLRKYFEEKYKDHLQKDEIIKNEVQLYFNSGPLSSLGICFVAGMVIKNKQAEVSVKRFVRWVDKKEFEEKAKEAKRRESKDDKEVWTSDRWNNQLSFEQKKEKCSTCPLNTCLSGEKNDSGCYRGTSYSHIGTFIDYISRFGRFPLLEEQLNSDGEFRVGDFSRLKDEVSRAKKVLTSNRVHAVNIYDTNGNLIRTSPRDTGSLYGNSIYGYGVGLEGEEEAITVIFKGVSIFSIPTDRRKAILSSEGLEGIMSLSRLLEKNQPRMYFTEIYSNKGTFFGKTRRGQEIELPMHNGMSPLSGHGNDVARMEFTTTPAKEAFGYIVDLLDKQLAIAKEYQIDIIGS
ncbi:MAG TPA: hypothetical protein VJH92_06250 [Candidatus Nanoarchaeia archaeon]|nr:hypothetical protein [Candidatus Nanoarchaeia archaeon]